MITLNQKPQTFTPVGSPSLFVLSSTTANIIYYNVQVLDATAGAVIANQKYQTLPNFNNGTGFDLSNILSNLVDYQLVISNNIIEPTPNIIQAYNLKVTENYFSGNTIYSGLTLSSSTFNVWNGGLNRVDFSSYSYLNYTLNTSGNTTQFLTDKPLVTNLYRTSTEFLYFLNAGLNANIQLNVYGSGNILIGTHTITGITASNKAYRLNTSPALLSSFYGTDFGNAYGGEFPECCRVPLVAR